MGNAENNDHYNDDYRDLDWHAYWNSGQYYSHNGFKLGKIDIDDGRYYGTSTHLLKDGKYYGYDAAKFGGDLEDQDEFAYWYHGEYYNKKGTCIGNVGDDGIYYGRDTLKFKSGVTRVHSASDSPTSPHQHKLKPNWLDRHAHWDNGKYYDSKGNLLGRMSHGGIYYGTETGLYRIGQFYGDGKKFFAKKVSRKDLAKKVGTIEKATVQVATAVVTQILVNFGVKVPPWVYKLLHFAKLAPEFTACAIEHWKDLHKMVPCLMHLATVAELAVTVGTEDDAMIDSTSEPSEYIKQIFHQGTSPATHFKK